MSIGGTISGNGIANHLLGVIPWKSLQWMAILVWFGFALLTVSLLVLMRSSWGRDKPLAKCVALSLMAHAWLALSAYGTRLVIQQPTAEREPVFHLKSIDIEESAPKSEKTQRDALQPWELAEESQASEPDVSVDEPAGAAVAAASEIPRETRVDSDSDLSQLAASAPWSEAPEAVDRPTTLPETPRATQEATPVREVARAAEAPATDTLPKEVPRAGLTDIVGLPSDELAPAPQAIVPEPAVARRVGDLFEPAATETSPLELVELPTSRPDPKSAAPLEMKRLRPSELRKLVTELPPLVRPGDGRTVPKPYRLRLDAEREKWFHRMGGSAESWRAIESALKWLAANQSTDGRWEAGRLGGGQETQVAGHDRRGAGANADTGMTGLALLAFLGAGQTQYQGDYTQVVQRGLNYLRRQQRTDGCLSGSSRLFAAMYCHGIAALAISEAYALTGDPELRMPTVRAIEFSLRAQHRRGGWRYQPGDTGDMSQFGWQVMAVASARYAGLGIAETERDRMRDFLQRCSVGPHRALAGYRPGERASETMSAEAMVCRVFLDQVPSKQGIDEFQKYIARELPRDGQANLYYWYYGTLALHQLQGPTWDNWSRALQRQLVKRQRTGGDLKGSWDPDTVWGGYGGRVYSTSLAALSLEIYYRYLPIYAWKQ